MKTSGNIRRKLNKRVGGQGKAEGFLNTAPKFRGWLGGEISFTQTASQELSFSLPLLNGYLYSRSTLTTQPTAFPGEFIEKNYLPCYMPAHELKDLGFVFPVTSEDITKGSKLFLLPRHSAVFPLQTKQTEPGLG